MLAAVFHGDHDIRVENVADPASPGAGQVLVRPLWCGICGTDLHEYAMGPIVIPGEPHRLNGAKLPQVLGHEFSAEVMEVGPDVTQVQVGQRVSIMPLLYCGACYYCRRGLNHLCVSMACIGLSYDWGGIAELAVVPVTHVTPLPDGVSDLQGALVEPTAVAAYGVDVAGVRPGDTVLVTGAGPIGVLASLYAAQLGARVVISEVNAIRAELARSLDVGEVVDPTQVDVAAWMKDQTEGVGADAVIECSGNERALQTAIDAVRSAGRISQTGLHTRAASIEPMKLSEHDITLTGTWCYPITDWPRIIDLIARGRLPVEKVVTAQVPMADVVARGFEVLLSPTGDQVKVLIDAQQGGAR
jgi:(R,R)-butanediol dehydrogenase / meso-butanediol dehydrogenase / diacetyl reductase